MAAIRMGKRIAGLFFGLFLFATGIVLTIHANIGAPPWDALHLGLLNYSSLTLGQVSQVVGLVIIAVCIVLKEFPGWGTLANMYFIGYFIDLLQGNHLIPQAGNFFGGILMLLLGIFVIGWATYFYLGAALGSGPRDGLMLGLSKRFNVEIWKARTLLEISVVISGFLLGGPIGLGTLTFALLMGPAVQLPYLVMHRQPKAIIHRSLLDDYRLLASSSTNQS